MKILTGNTADNIRKKYILHFVDTEGDYYTKLIQKLDMCSDGMCYTGYLWDCFKNKFLMPEQDCIQYLANADSIYVFWDIHSKDRILIPNYWKYPKDAVLQMNYDEFLINIPKFPEDIYILDDSFEWSVALTHETDTKENRYCLFAYP